MRKILVTAISGDLSNGILKCLRATGDELYGCDIYDYSIGMDKVKDFLKICSAKDSQYIDVLLSYCQSKGITHIIPGNESEIKKISQNRIRFKNAGIKLLIQEERILDIFLDKLKTNQHLRRIGGISTPKTYSFEEFPDTNNWYIVKPRFSNGSKFIQKARKAEDIYIPIGMSKSDFIVQEYISEEDGEYTVGVFSDGKEIRTVIFRRKLKDGYTFIVNLVEDKEIEKDAKVIAHKIRLKGYINIQLRKWNGKNYIFEINPRISGSVVFRHLVGFDDVLWWLDLVDDSFHQKEYCQKYTKAIGIKELTEKMLIIE